MCLGPNATRQCNNPRANPQGPAQTPGMLAACAAHQQSNTTTPPKTPTSSQTHQEKFCYATPRWRRQLQSGCSIHQRGPRPPSLTPISPMQAYWSGSLLPSAAATGVWTHHDCCSCAQGNTCPPQQPAFTTPHNSAHCLLDRHNCHVAAQPLASCCLLSSGNKQHMPTAWASTLCCRLCCCAGLAVRLHASRPQ